MSDESLSLQYVKSACSQKDYDKSLEIIGTQVLEHILPPEVIKEVIWLLKADYENQMVRRAKIAESIYTPEQIEVLHNFYMEHPWATARNIEMQKKITAQEQLFGEEIMKKAMENLAERGEFESSMENMGNCRAFSGENDEFLDRLLEVDQAARNTDVESE